MWNHRPTGRLTGAPTMMDVLSSVCPTVSADGVAASNSHGNRRNAAPGESRRLVTAAHRVCLKPLQDAVFRHSEPNGHENFADFFASRSIPLSASDVNDILSVRSPLARPERSSAVRRSSVGAAAPTPWASSRDSTGSAWGYGGRGQDEFPSRPEPPGGSPASVLSRGGGALTVIPPRPAHNRKSALT